MGNELKFGGKAYKQCKNMKCRAVHDRKSVHSVAFLEKDRLICESKKFNIDFWKLLDACSFEAGITYTTDFIVPELFKSPQNRYILMPFIGDLSRDNFKGSPNHCHKYSQT